ncbi:hypothetical protein EYC98_16490 [Halieaceae bacterium IMCC14734]|uniref:YhdP central domain-containing protein n=1 Tax=Candidatus Litorirhabdus singularis TaxID=2518993 RepID=A0ABT3TJK6_9GAMM|nr:AsmA-like C-terminal region-containing protein [Candidatus Litorirhabdus singularis]MCX2982464.1 hypothetical protein [Candidatus Litorirhabdus singularis]
MTHSFLNRLTNTLWVAIAIFVMLLATYVSLGRFVVARVSEFQQPILEELNQRLGMVIEADHIRGRWTAMAPYLELEGVRILGDEHTPVAVHVERLNIGLNLAGTVASLKVEMHALVARGLQLHVDIAEDGTLAIPGIPAGGGLSKSLLRFIFATGSLELEQARVLVHEGEIEHDFRVDLNLRRDEDFRRLRASVLSPSQRSWFRVIAEGIGEPTELDELRAQVHIESHVPEVSNYTGLAEAAGFRLENGELDGQLWLNIDAGQVQVLADFAAGDLQIQQLVDNGKRLELDELSAQVHAATVDGRWHYGASGINARIGDKTFQLNAMSGVLDDGQLDLRTSVVDLGSLSDYLIEEDFLPPGLADVVAILAPAGSLQTLQLKVSDLSDPGGSWQVNANFDDLSVASWRGAPEVRNAAGFLALEPRVGTVQMRSSEFSLGFPTVYRHPLEYDEFAAELGWFVTEENFQLFSGPFTGVGEEGRVRGLFSLNVPLQATEAGLEMELMVGLEDASPTYRYKYLPYTLPDSLLDWLAGSIGEADIVHGGFIFRGSLRSGATDRRSVQLYFNVADAILQYHPDWPSLSDLEGTLFIDDSHVSGSGLRGQIYGSELQVTQLDLEPFGQGLMQLSVTGSALGAAADGLSVLLNSPLANIVGDAFTGWELDGELSTELDLQLVLGNSAAVPKVTVRTQWESVDLTTATLGVPVDDISGQLNYDWREGFTATDIRGSLWGKPLLASVSQQTSDNGPGLLDVRVDGQVGAESLRNWLQLDLLRLATGVAAVELHILMPPGETGQIVMASDLQGVALDLPPGFAKASEQVSDLRLTMPLDGERRQLDIDYEERAFVSLLLDAGGYHGASLGFNAQPLPVVEDTFLISGALPAVEAESWWSFIDNYILGDDLTTGSVALSEPSAQPSAQPPAPLPGPEMPIVVSGLQVSELCALGICTNTVLLDAEQGPGQWQIGFALPWLDGTAVVADDLSWVQLDLQRLDIQGIDPQWLKAADPDAVSKLELPSFEWKIENLWSGSQRWGELNFSLQEQGDTLQFRDIFGNLRGLQLGVDEAPMNLDWRRSGDEVDTRLWGPVHFVDFGDVLASFSYERIIETNSGRVDIDLAWPASPLDFALLGTSGQLVMNVDEGRFLNASGAAEGTLRVVAIVNLAEFVRRLSLDLNSLAKSGVPFDSITGELLFDNDVIDVPLIDVAGRGSRFQFVGLADIGSETVAGELVATLPVASNLPWIAALVAGLPVAAGVFVVSQIFSEQMDRFSSAIYNIEGPWNNPEVDFKRIFDDVTPPQNGRAPELPTSPAAVDVLTSEEVAVPAANQSAEPSAAGPEAAEPDAAEETELVIPAEVKAEVKGEIKTEALPETLPDPVPDPVPEVAPSSTLKAVPVD